MTLTTNLIAGFLTVDSTNEHLTLGSNCVLMLRNMTVNGTLYSLPGEYSVSSWRGGTAPVNVSGDGTIVVISSGTVIVLR